MIKWFNNYAFEGCIIPLDTVYILPYETDHKNGIEIFYNDEFCIVENIGVKEFVEALKTLEDSPSFKTDFKTEVERVVNHLFLPPKPATT